LLKDTSVTGKRLSTMSIWLGLFAMLMIHVGPLYSALQVARTPASPVVTEGHHAHASSAHDQHQHRHAPAGEPAWLAALELCGYCELLTLNPPLSLSLDLALPRHTPVVFQPLPESPLPPVPRRSSGHPRAPPLFHC